MAEGYKKSFILYTSLLEDIQKFTDEQAGIFILNILLYVNNESVETDLMKEKFVYELYLKTVSDIEYEWSKYNPLTKKFHWNYKGGISPENHIIRNSEKMKRWRYEVFKRDQYTCQHCAQIGGNLNAHHIKPFSEFIELRFDVSNGLTLCKSCHIKEHKRLTNAR